MTLAWSRGFPSLFLGLLAACATAPEAPPEAPSAAGGSSAAPTALAPPASAPAGEERVALAGPTPVAVPAPETPAPAVPAPASLYRCLKLVQGAQSWTPIEFSPKVENLCRRHPEMGPCQYQREACRRSGGRVFDEGGSELTRKTEAEYDRRVLRLKFRS